MAIQLSIPDKLKKNSVYIRVLFSDFLHNIHWRIAYPEATLCARVGIISGTFNYEFDITEQHKIRQSKSF